MVMLKLICCYYVHLFTAESCEYWHYISWEPPGGTLVNYIYRCGTWWEVGKLMYMVAALPREKISCFFLVWG